MSENDQAPREFQPVDDPNEALKLVREGAKTLSSAMIWTKNQEHVINTHMAVYSDAAKCFYCWIPKDFDAKQFMSHMSETRKKTGEEECFFSVSLLRANIFFKAKFLGLDSAGLQFKIPSKVYKVQRRKDLRFPVPDGLIIRVEFDDPLDPGNRLTKKIIDISASGLAFLVSEEEAPVYPQGLTLKNVSFTIRNRKITVNAEIRHSRKLRPEGRLKGNAIGILFKEIRPGDSQHVAGFVFEESRKYFSRFI